MLKPVVHRLVRLAAPIFFASVASGQPVYGQTELTLQERANAAVAAANWKESIPLLVELLSADESVGDNWFRLGRARHETGDREGARGAYEQALRHETTRVSYARFHLSRLYAAMDETAAALRQLEAIAETGGVNFRVVEQADEFASLRDLPRYRSVLEALRPCGASEYRQFDFWIGDWDVSVTATASPTARNTITSVHDGCAVLENYQLASGTFAGTSINFFDSNTGRWHQAWMSNAGSAVHLEGGLNSAGEMVMSDENLGVSHLTGTTNRVTWSPLGDGRVRQHWQTRSADSEQWTTVFDGYYTRK